MASLFEAFEKLQRKELIKELRFRLNLNAEIEEEIPRKFFKSLKNY